MCCGNGNRGEEIFADLSKCASSRIALDPTRSSSYDGKASRWLTVASRGLGGEVPLQMLDTDVGTQHVQQELCEIEFGMPL